MTVYESQNGLRIDGPSEPELDDALSKLNGAENSYASLAAADGSYVQVGGGPDGFTVELRRAGAGGEFRHFKATLSDRRVRSKRRLLIGGADVTVRDDQVFVLAQVQEIFRSFLMNRPAAVTIDWEDMTAMFH